MGKELITEEFKMMVVQYVLDGHTRRETSEKFGVSCTPIEKWVNLYKLHGAEGLLSRNLVGRQKGFDSEFRLKVLQYKQEHNLSCTQTAMHFCLDVVTVCRWDKKFREKGMQGLMWSRPSAYHYNSYVEGEDGTPYYTDGTPFSGLGSGSNNYAPSNPALAERVEQDLEAFLKKNPDVKKENIPTDLLTASGSGLDPHISPASAEIQIPRIAKASGLDEEKLREIVKNNTSGKLFGIFGEETVNVLKVNIEIAKNMGIL